VAARAAAGGRGKQAGNSWLETDDWKQPTGNSRLETAGWQQQV